MANSSVLVSPKCSCKGVISALRLSRPVLLIVESSLWSTSARDLLRQARALC